ncbi:RsmB/NOP family class I SAM-dependent RNA methyltransferase [Dyadobacter jejuensis]|nr:RsmB/NOP family class I SAM-dependent RNA methyltransferase [Dyadobacter jejuensis]
MKIHRSLAEAVVHGLEDIFKSGRQADKVVEALLKSNKKWGKRDRSFIAEHIYESVRWWRLISFVADQEQPHSRQDFWKALQIWLTIKPVRLSMEQGYSLPDWPEFPPLDQAELLQRYHQGMKIRKIAHSIPDWLDRQGVGELSEKWVNELIAQNSPAPVYLRVNSLKTTLEDVLQIFGPDDALKVPGIPSALRLVKRQNVATRDSFKMGYFEIQDAGSQLIAPFVNPQPGELIIDACAGAGGKALHMASLMGNQGRIIAMDVEAHKLQELERRAKRNGATIIESQVIRSDRDLERFTNKADRVLLDVPCSGLGVLRRNPDAKWKLTSDFLEEIRKVQADILLNYSRMVRVGGALVYATCSILPSESEVQVAQFLERAGDNWKLVKEHRTNPFTEDIDGFYMAFLERVK